MKNIFFTIIALLFTHLLSGQTSNCQIFSPNVPSNLYNNNTQCFNFNQNYNQAPILNININVHIFRSFRNETDAQLVASVRSLIDESNRVLTDLQENFGNRTPAIRNAKIKMKFFSNTTTQPNDVFGGIWIYPYTGQQVISATPPSPYQNRYGSNVLDIIIMNTGTGSRGAVITVGAGNSYNWIQIADLNDLVFQSQAPGYDNSYNSGTANLRQLSRVLNHELGHTLNLNHVEYCENECGNININPNSDITPASECGSRCPNVNVCEGDNPGTVVCNDGDRNCLWANSAMMMAQGIWQHSVTPCQWAIIFNYIRNNPPNYAKLCFTASIFTLTTSPLNDYRASQSITSTSVIQGNRQVDYWSPTITLNPGFEVQQGTAFVAGPTTFPCCPGSGNGGGNAIAENDNQTSINKIKDGLLVTPNPFNESVNIDYEVNQDFENVNMSLIDINGRVLKNIQTESKNKGHYQVQVKTNDLPNGVYFIRYKSQYKIAIQKVIKSASN